MRTARSAALVTLLFGLVGCGSTVEVEPDGGGGSGAGASGATGSGTGPSKGAGPGATGPGSGPGGTGPGSSGTESGSGSTGGPGSGPTGATTGTGLPVCASLGDGCTDCISTTCNASWCECTANPECTAIIECWYSCATDDCFASCNQTYPNGVSDAALAIGCPGCTGSCGTDPIDPCQECIYSSCEDEMNACFAVPECLLLWDCLSSCPGLDLSCQQGCYDAYGAGVESLQTALECVDGACTPQCGG